MKCIMQSTTLKVNNSKGTNQRVRVLMSTTFKDDSHKETSHCKLASNQDDRDIVAAVKRDPHKKTMELVTTCASAGKSCKATRGVHI